MWQIYRCLPINLHSTHKLYRKYLAYDEFNQLVIIFGQRAMISIFFYYNNHSTCYTCFVQIASYSICYLRSLIYVRFRYFLYCIACFPSFNINRTSNSIDFQLPRSSHVDGSVVNIRISVYSIQCKYSCNRSTFEDIWVPFSQIIMKRVVKVLR